MVLLNDTAVTPQTCCHPKQTVEGGDNPENTGPPATNFYLLKTLN